MNILRFNEKINSTNNKFWSVKTDMPYFEIRLKKIGCEIGCDTDLIQYLIYNSTAINWVTIYVYFNMNTKLFDWMPGNEYGKSYLISCNYLYEGEICITNKDINEYNISKTANKFNI